MTHVWITEVDQETPWVREHVHDYDEVLTWTGSDPEHPRELGAEIFLEIEANADSSRPPARSTSRPGCGTVPSASSGSTGPSPSARCRSIDE